MPKSDGGKFATHPGEVVGVAAVAAVAAASGDFTITRESSTGVVELETPGKCSEGDA